MSGRIITLQRQARELGRLRAGTFEQPPNAKGRPTRSKTWILTTHQREYLDAAAEQWGGEVTRWQPQGGGAEAWRLITDAVAVDAILPSGDPLSQHYEMWSKGGCQRRCDGETEALAAKPCLCLAQFGPEFHLQKPEDACRPHTRLNVILPDVPDLGVWRMESKGFYAANEIAASIDLIRSATGGQVMVPIRLRIEPRKRVAQGKTKQFPVIVVEIRGATAGQILSGVAPALAVEGAPQHAAIEAAPAEAPPNGATHTAAQLLALVKLTKNPAQLRSLWEDARRVDPGDPDLPALKAAFESQGRKLQPVDATPAAAQSPVEAEVEPDADGVWALIVAAAPAEWGTDGLEQRVCALLNKSSADAGGFELQRFLTALKNGEVN